MYYIWLPGGRSDLLHRRTQRLSGLIMNSRTNVVKRDPHEWTVTKCVFVMNSSVWIAMIEWNERNCISHAEFDLFCCFCCCLDFTVLCSHSQSKSLLLAIISKSDSYRTKKTSHELEVRIILTSTLTLFSLFLQYHIKTTRIEEYINLWKGRKKLYMLGQ